jgi:serine/threonine protein kinase
MSKPSYDDNHSDTPPPTEARIALMKRITERGYAIDPMIDPENADVDDESLRKLRRKIINIVDFIKDTNSKLRYVKSGTTGHTFKAYLKDDSNVVFAIKVSKYPKDDYGPMNSIRRPENVELRIIKMLAPFVTQRKAPHLIIPYYSFTTDINPFVDIPRNIVDIDDKKNELYRNFIEEYREGLLENYVSILMTEWCDGGDLLDYVRKNWENMNRRVWKVILFQLLYTIAKIHEKYPAFRHNDLKANNILVRLTECSSDETDYFEYEFGNFIYVIPNIGIQIGIWDFDFACIGGIVENNKVDARWTTKIGVSNTPNRYYDIHYFFNSLFGGRFIKDIHRKVPPEIIEFVSRVVPRGYRRSEDGKVNKKHRLIVNEELTTAARIITRDPLFESYRHRRHDD